MRSSASPAPASTGSSPARDVQAAIDATAAQRRAGGEPYGTRGGAACPDERLPQGRRRPPCRAAAARSPRRRCGSTSTSPSCSRSASAAKAAGKPVPGLLAYLARFTVAGTAGTPRAQRRGRHRAHDELIQYAGINLGLAVQTDRGLLAPAVLDAHRLTTAELDDEIRRVTEAAREGRATQAELTARHVHAQQLRGVQRRRQRRDHQPPAGRDPRLRPGHRPGLGGRRRAGGPQDRADVVRLRPPGVRRRDGRWLHAGRRRRDRVTRLGDRQPLSPSAPKRGRPRPTVSEAKGRTRAEMLG